MGFPLFCCQNKIGIENQHNLFFASVESSNGQLVESGSRTIAVVGIADSISEAEKIAEKEVSLIVGPLFHRTDIGTDAVIQKRIEHMNSFQ